MRSSTRRSAGARWGPPTARWRSWSAARETAFAAARAGARADGLEGRACRADRGRHADQAGPQPAPLRRVHRRHRGAAAGRGGRARPGRAGRGGPAHRRDHRRARARSCTATPRRRWRRTTSGTASSTTCARSGRRTCRSRSSWPPTLGVDVPLAQLSRENLAKGLGAADGQVRRPPRGAAPRPGEDGAGLRLRDVRRRRATSSATPPTTSSATSGSGPASPTATGGCC